MSQKVYLSGTFLSTTLSCSHLEQGVVQQRLHLTLKKAEVQGLARGFPEFVGTWCQEPGLGSLCPVMLPHSWGGHTHRCQAHSWRLGHQLDLTGQPGMAAPSARMPLRQAPKNAGDTGKRKYPQSGSKLCLSGTESNRGNWAPLNIFDVQVHVLLLTPLTVGTPGPLAVKQQTRTQTKDSHSSTHRDIGNLTQRGWKPFGFQSSHFSTETLTGPLAAPSASASVDWGSKPVLRHSTQRSRSRVCAVLRELMQEG